MTLLTQIVTYSPSMNILQICRFRQKGHRCFSRPQVASFRQRDFKLKASQKKRRFLELCRRKDLFLVGDGGHKSCRSEVIARFSPGFGLNGGNGGGKDDSRVVVNLALAIGLTCLGSLVGFSILVIVLVPIVGLGAFFWWAGKDVVESTSPSCGQEFKTFKSLLDDELQLCPYCTQPFSVVDNKFVKEPVNFKNEFTSKSKSDPRAKRDSSTAIVDVEAEVKDVE